MDYQRHPVQSSHDVHSKLFERLLEARRHYDKAISQIGVLDLQMRELETRYKRAVKNKKNSFRYNLRLKLSVITGIKMMFNHYATKKAEEMHVCSQQLDMLYNNDAQNYDQGESSSPDNLQDSASSSPALSPSTDDYSSGSDA